MISQKDRFCNRCKCEVGGRGKPPTFQVQHTFWIFNKFKDEYMSVGYYNINWDASSSPSGIYFVKMISDGFIQTEKVVLVK